MMDKIISESISATEKIFKKTHALFEGISEDYFIATGLQRREAFRLFFEQACIIYRTLLINEGSGNGSKATVKQLNYITMLQESVDFASDIVKNYLAERGKSAISELSVKEASELIDMIQQRRRR